jgi:hypothetical protein
MDFCKLRLQRTEVVEHSTRWTLCIQHPDWPKWGLERWLQREATTSQQGCDRGSIDQQPRTEGPKTLSTGEGSTQLNWERQERIPIFPHNALQHTAVHEQGRAIRFS